MKSNGWTSQDFRGGGGDGQDDDPGGGVRVSGKYWMSWLWRESCNEIPLEGPGRPDHTIYPGLLLGGHAWLLAEQLPEGAVALHRVRGDRCSDFGSTSCPRHQRNPGRDCC